MKILKRGRRWLAVAALLTTGCASLPDDLGRADVDELVAARGLSIPHPGDDAITRVATLLEQPLRAEDAVEVALLNNADLRAEYARLGFGAADVYEASRIRNPVFSIARLDSDEAGARDQVSVGLVASLSDLITMPARRREAELAYSSIRAEVAAATMATAAETQTAYYAYAGALQRQALLQAVAEAEQLACALAQRYFDAGNLPAWELSRHVAAAAEAELDVVAAESDSAGARARLANSLGVSVGEEWTLSSALTLPPEQEPALEPLLTAAVDQRLDLKAAESAADASAAAAGLANWQGLLGELHLGFERERETDGSTLRGPELEWELPVFGRGRDGKLRADAKFSQALSGVARLRTEINNEVRTAYAGVLNRRDRIRQIRDQLIPARQAVVSHMQRRVNYMLEDVFELLETKQSEYAAYERYVDAIAEYWLAKSALAEATGGTIEAADIGAPFDVETLLRVEDAHHHHGEHP